jgi:excisionase family DNA binding protein
MSTTEPAPLLWSVPEAAIRLGLSRAEIYRLLAARQLASLKHGRRRLIADAELRRFVAAKQAESAEW